MCSVGAKLAAAPAMDLFEDALERVRRRYLFAVAGYVVMPEHVHLLVNEPKRALLSKAIQALKLSVSMRSVERPFWQAHYYDFNVSTHGKFVEKLRYMHRNPAIYQELDGALPGGIWSMPAYYRGQVYFGAVGGPIRAFRFSKAVLSSTPVSTTGTQFPYPGATPSISANGAANGILWAVENNSPAVLHAYLASNLAQELYNTNQAANGRDNFGAGNKFMVPTIANGKVYVGTPNGVAAFGLLSQPALTAPTSTKKLIDVEKSEVRSQKSESPSDNGRVARLLTARSEERKEGKKIDI